MMKKAFFFFAIFFATLRATGQVCQIGTTTYTTLDAALAAVTNGQTIKLLSNITYNSGIIIEGKSITFDLNGKKLDITNPAGDGLDVGNNGEVKLADPSNGEFNVTGSYDGSASNFEVDGVFVHNSGKATVTNATSTGNNDFCMGACSSGGTITVIGNATASGNGINEGAYAANGTVTVGGNAIANGTGGRGIEVGTGGNVTVNGDVTGIFFGVFSVGGVVTVNGNVTATASGVGSTGAYADSGGKITINGFITAPDIYIKVGTTTKFAAQYTTPTTLPGYLTYTDGTNTVWVNANPFSVSATSMNFASSGGNQTFDIQSVTTWMVGSSDSWLTVSPASGSNNGTITVTAAANTTSAARTATVTIMGSGVTAKTITITQDAAVTAIETIETPDINVYSQFGNVIVDSKMLTIKSVLIYSVSGQLIKTVESSSNNVSISGLPSKHIFIVKIVMDNGKTVEKKIIVNS